MTTFRVTWQQRGGIAKDPDKTVKHEEFIENEEYFEAVRGVDNLIKTLKNDKYIYGYCFSFEVWELKEGVIP